MGQIHLSNKSLMNLFGISYLKARPGHRKFRTNNRQKVAEESEKTWGAPLLQQVYFIERLCVEPVLTNIAREKEL